MGSLSAAIGLHRNDRIDEAERAYCAIVAAEPQHAGALQLLGALRQQQGRYEEALELIGRAITVNPANAVFHNNYGAALLSLERFADAKESLSTAVRLCPDYPDALANLGLAETALGREDAAMVCYRTALRNRRAAPGRAAAFGGAAR